MTTRQVAITGSISHSGNTLVDITVNTLLVVVHADGSNGGSLPLSQAITGLAPTVAAAVSLATTIDVQPGDSILATVTANRTRPNPQTDIVQRLGPSVVWTEPIVGVTLLDGSVLHVGDTVIGYFYNGTTPPTPTSGPVVDISAALPLLRDAYGRTGSISVYWGQNVAVPSGSIALNTTTGVFGMGPGGVPYITVGGMTLVVSSLIQVVDTVNRSAFPGNVVDLSTPNVAKVLLTDGRSLNMPVSDIAFNLGGFIATGAYSL